MEIANPNASTEAKVEYGLAAEYLYDEGIKNHPAVIHATGFESADWLETEFDYNSWIGHRGYQVTSPDLAFSGHGVLEYQNEGGEHYPHVFQIRDFETEGVIFLRWYRRFQSGYDFSCQSKSNGVYARCHGCPESSAGVKPDGYDKYSCKLQFWRGGEPKFYTYHPEQQGNYGDTLPQNVGEKIYIEPGRWYCFEIMLKPNDAGERNGEIKLWIDGMLKAHYPDMRFRDTNDLKINELDITAYVGGHCVAPRDQKVWDDNLVLATEYIGPMVTEVMSTPHLDEIIIDNTDAGFAISYSQDPWQEYTKVGGQHYGNSHHYNKQIGTGQDTAVWSFTVPKSGNYDVYAWWCEADWRPPDVPYTINHSGGSTTVRVDQRANGGQWNLLGTFYFLNEGSVVVSDDVSSGRDIVADAIRLAYSSEGSLGIVLRAKVAELRDVAAEFEAKASELRSIVDELDGTVDRLLGDATLAKFN